MSRLSVIITFTDSRFRPPLHLETKPYFGWSHPEAQIVTWMSSRHREPENLPEEVAQECIQDQNKEDSQGERSEACILSHQKVWEYLPANGSATDASGERGNSLEIQKVQSSISDSNVMEEAISLTEIGSNSSGKEATRQDSGAIQGHTRGEVIEPEMMGHVLIHHNWKEFVFHRGCSFNQKSILCAGLIAGGREGRDTRYTVFFTPVNHGVSKKKKSIVVILRDP